MHYNFYYDVAAMILMAVLIIFFYEKNIIRTRLSSFFEILLWATFISNTLDFIRAVIISDGSRFGILTSHALVILSMVSVSMIPGLYYIYSLRSISKARHLNWPERLGALIPFSIVAILIVSSPWTGLVYKLSEKGELSYGILGVVLYVHWVIYLVHILRSMAKKWDKIEPTSKYAILGGSIVTVIACVVTYFIPQLLLVNFAASLAVLLQYIAMESVDDYTNDKLEVLNENAFIDKVNVLLESKSDFEIYAIKLDGIAYLRSVLGRKNINNLLKSISNNLENFTQGMALFYLGASRFAIMAEREPGNWALLSELIEKYFKDTVEYGNITISIDAIKSIIPTDLLKKVEKADDVIRLIDAATSEAMKVASDELYVASDDTLADTRRKEEILHILKGAVREQHFEVYYQPIYSVKKQRYVSAEALVRLKNDRLGYISPEEFIPIAERNGLILEIGDFVFRTVCKCIMDNKICERGIEFIEVNLSVVQCMQDDLHEQLVSIMDEYRLPYHYINLEITESTATLSKDTLKENMEQLIKRGINFALDDYGTGFSNMMRIVDYPFHAVKLDKSLLWSAADKPKAKHALEYSIQMVKAMELDVICEGVETFAQADMLEKMGCDYFQGYYFSKPVPVDDFLTQLARDQAMTLLTEE